MTDTLRIESVETRPDGLVTEPGDVVGHVGRAVGILAHAAGGGPRVENRPVAGKVRAQQAA